MEGILICLIGLINLLKFPIRKIDFFFQKHRRVPENPGRIVFPANFKGNSRTLSPRRSNCPCAFWMKTRFLYRVVTIEDEK